MDQIKKHGSLPVTVFRCKTSSSCYKKYHDVKKKSKFTTNIKYKFKNLSALQLPHYKINDVMLLNQKKNCSQQRLVLVDLIKQKLQLLKELKMKIQSYKDNILLNKFIKQIKYLISSQLILDIWTNIDIYSKCTIKQIKYLQIKYQFIADDQFIQSLNYVNNVILYMLADYKRKTWNYQIQQIDKQIIAINDSMKLVKQKVYNLDNYQTKLQIITTIVNLKQQCHARKQQYVDWKIKALQKLKQRSIKCQIVKAEVFTQGFF